jgi:acyl transferase domain-containing protein
MMKDDLELFFFLSLGEISAFYAAGWLTAKEALQLAALRGKVMHLNSGRMIALNCTKEEAASLLQQLTKTTKETISIANLNHPTQVVVSGTAQSIQQLATLAQSVNVKSTVLHVREAFHCALMQPAAERFLREIQQYHVLTSSTSSSSLSHSKQKLCTFLLSYLLFPNMLSNAIFRRIGLRFFCCFLFWFIL